MYTVRSWWCCWKIGIRPGKQTRIGGKNGGKGKKKRQTKNHQMNRIHINWMNTEYTQKHTQTDQLRHSITLNTKLAGGPWLNHGMIANCRVHMEFKMWVWTIWISILFQSFVVTQLLLLSVSFVHPPPGIWSSKLIRNPRENGENAFLWRVVSVGQVRAGPIDKLDEGCINVDDQMTLVQHHSGDRVMN